MGHSVSSSLCSMVLALALVFNSHIALGQMADPMEERLFLFTESDTKIPHEKGFSARCWHRGVWFKQATQEEANNSGNQTILFTDSVVDMMRMVQREDSSPLCFTRSGNFLSCAEAEQMALKIGSGWKTCQLIEFNDPAPSFIGSLQQITKSVFKFAQEHLIMSIVSSVILTGTIVGTIMYRLNQNRMDLMKGKTSPSGGSV